jgi:phenylalanyl-tRNA synthetase alpha subunit
MTTSIYINTSTLPSDVFDLKYDDFYNFVDFQCGPIQTDILKFQLISDANIFIECDDPTEIMKYNSDKLNELKDKSCLMLNDGSTIVLPGITASFNNLKKRLLKKIDQDMKELKKNKNISNASTPLTVPTTSQSRSIDELRSHIIKSVDQWIEKYRNDFNMQANSSLVETIDYNIEFMDTVGCYYLFLWI